MLSPCWTTVYDAGPTLKQHSVNISDVIRQNTLKKGSNVEPLLTDVMFNVKCDVGSVLVLRLSSVCDADTTLNQH